jgi:hypothetical protein
VRSPGRDITAAAAVAAASVILLAVTPPRANADPFNFNPQRVAAARERAKLPVDQNAVLDGRLPEVNLKQVPLDDTLAFLRDVSGLHLLLDWDDLRAAGLQRRTPVTLELKNATVREVLYALLVSAGAKPGDLKLRVIDELAVVATPQRGARIEELLRNDATSPPETAAGNPTTRPRPLDARIASVLLDPCLGDSAGVIARGVPLRAALEQVSSVASVPITADWAELARGRVDGDRVIDTRIPNVSLRSALVVLLADSGLLDRCDFHADGNAVRLTLRAGGAGAGGGGGRSD